MHICSWSTCCRLLFPHANGYTDPPKIINLGVPIISLSSSRPPSCEYNKVQSMLTGPAISSVPPGLVEKIESGVFVDMGDLVPHRLELEEITRSKQKHQAISTISKWLQAFAVYVAIISKKQPDRVPDLMGCQVLMLEASNEYKKESWLAYDRLFRQLAASDPHCKWSNINTTLEFSLCFAGQSKPLQTLF